MTSSIVGGGAGLAQGQFSSPWGIAADSFGNIFVADTGNNRIQKFSKSGTFVTAFGTGGMGDGQFKGPRGVAVDLDDNVYVSDTVNNRIQRFSPVP